MIWIINQNESHQIISCNTNPNTDEHGWELWVTRPNGKNLKVYENEDRVEVELRKEAIDYALKNNKPTIELD